jgi:hypothetical protein
MIPYSAEVKAGADFEENKIAFSFDVDKVSLLATNNYNELFFF